MSHSHTITEVDELVINGTTFLLNQEELNVTVETDEKCGHVVSKRVVAEIIGEVYVESGTKLEDFVTPVEDAYDDD
jgi:hypothetical protein